MSLLEEKRKLFRKTRKHIRSTMTIDFFFQELNRRNVQYVILRWFEKLPELEDGEDVDILIADEDLDRTLDLYDENNIGIPIDTYTIQGTRNGGYGATGPYFPVKWSQQIIKSRRLLNDTYYVPNTENHFLSMLYHVVYHKAEKSGLPLDDETGPTHVESEHYYEDVIKNFDMLDESYPINLKSLHQYLQNQGWSPSIDVLRKLYQKQGGKFLYDISVSQEKSWADPCDLIVFIVREGAFLHNEVMHVIDTIVYNKLDVICYYYLSDKEKEHVATQIRGGEWGKGPYAVSGGAPQLVLVAFDYHPQEPSEDEKKTHPFVKNRNVFVKNRVRDEINRKLEDNQKMNCMHSSDDIDEADLFIDIICPHLKSIVERRVLERVKGYQTLYKVEKMFNSYHTRSKVELINYNGKRAVKKTFKMGRERFLNREITAYRKLSVDNPYIPEVIEVGETYVIIPYYENILEQVDKEEAEAILRKNKDKIIDFLFRLYLSGFAFINFYPGNVIITPEEQLIVIDFEFLYTYETIPETFEKSYDISGIPEGFDGDMPRGLKYPGHTYESMWQSILGSFKHPIGAGTLKVMG